MNPFTIDDSEQPPKKRYRIYFENGTDKETGSYFLISALAPQMKEKGIVCITEERILFGEDFAPKLRCNL
jgi:hypothetical protein